MRKYLSAAAIAISALLLNDAVIAQDKEDKEKTKTRMGEYDEIIIKRKDVSKDGKVTIEIKDGEVKVNGKPIDEYDDDNLSVRKKKTLSYGVAAPSPFRSSMNFGDGHNFLLDEDRPFLGVTTDEGEGGAKITGITKNSAAEKAGLLKGDIITKVNDERIADHGDVTKVIGKLKPEDKVSISYKRDGKENKVTAVLGKRPGSTIYGPNSDFNFDFDHDGQLGQVFSYGGRPRIGIKAQDTDDGKGVKVIDVDEGSAADKSGIKENDVITEFEGKAVNSADALAEASRESKDKSSVKIKLNRGGNSQTIDVKIPRKLKTANL
ncbi:MAG: PDZ domain-containing protein [Chitinophagaceae bacterium]|nr:PDZ domain-containing protein [Chitinophagaceae bacterium]